MNTAPIHEGIRPMRFADILSRTDRSELSQMEAAEFAWDQRTHVPPLA